MKKPGPTASPWKKILYFIWEDDSLASWLVNVLLAFILVKFILYPGLGLVFGTQFPVVAVVSGSMEHDTAFDGWWNSQSDFYTSMNITKLEFQSYRFTNGFNKGDLMVLFGASHLQRGDVIVFKGSASEPIIHRIVKLSPGFYQTKGDHNPASRDDETHISPDLIYGKAVLRVPYLGWFKIFFVESLQKIFSWFA